MGTYPGLPSQTDGVFIKRPPRRNFGYIQSKGIDDDDDQTVRHSNCSGSTSVDGDAATSTASLTNSDSDEDRGCDHTSPTTPPSDIQSPGPGKARRKHVKRLQRRRSRRADLIFLQALAALNRHEPPPVTRAQAWKALVQQDRLYDSQHGDEALNERRMRRVVNYAISDSGATAHFICEGAPVVNVRPATIPLKITLPNGEKIESTHTCNLDIPWMSHAMTQAHIVPGLSHSSLISTKQLCDAGCQVVFDLDECRVIKEGQLLLLSHKCP